MADREPQDYDVYFDEIVAHCNDLGDFFIARIRRELPDQPPEP